METRRKTLLLDEGTISCLEWPGDGAGFLLFSHATGFNAETYRSLLAPLATRFQLMAVDYRGHGFSTVPTAAGLAHGWTIFRDDLLSVLGQVSQEPAILVGHSMGANVSLMAAALAPRRVRGLLLIEPVLIEPNVANEPNRLALRAAQRRSVFSSLEAAVESYRGRGIFASWPEAVLRDYLAGGTISTGNGTLRLACPPEWEAEIYRGAPVDIARLAGAIACPMTLMHGMHDSTAAPQQLAAIRSLKPECRIVAVEGAGHFLPIDRPDRVREEIRTTAAW